jgi:hypothetical protein
VLLTLAFLAKTEKRDSIPSAMGFRKRVNYGRPEKENLALAPQHAALASCPQTRCLCRMSQLRRTQAATPFVRRLRLLRRPRGGNPAHRNKLRLCHRLETRP